MTKIEDEYEKPNCEKCGFKMSLELKNNGWYWVCDDCGYEDLIYQNCTPIITK